MGAAERARAVGGCRVIDLIRPLFDARLVLALAIVGCATWALVNGKLDSTAWAGAIAACVWWAGSGSVNTKYAERGLR